MVRKLADNEGVGDIKTFDDIVPLLFDHTMYKSYPGRLSPDVLLLTQRMRAAAARGEPDRLDISPELRAKRDEFVKLMESRDEHVARFFDEISKKLRGDKGLSRRIR